MQFKLFRRKADIIISFNKASVKSIFSATVNFFFPVKKQLFLPL